MAAAANEEVIVERFVRLYATAERGRKLWEQWMSTQSEDNRSILEQLAEASAEERGIPIEEARGRLAAEKVIQDIGIDYAEKYLFKRDAADLKASRALKPMAALGAKKKK